MKKEMSKEIIDKNSKIYNLTADQININDSEIKKQSFIDKINAWNSRDEKLKIDKFTEKTYSLHYYPSILLIQKKIMVPPISKRKGGFIIPAINFPAPILKQSFLRRLGNKLKRILNRMRNLKK